MQAWGCLAAWSVMHDDVDLIIIKLVDLLELA